MLDLSNIERHIFSGKNLRIITEILEPVLKERARESQKNFMQNLQNHLVTKEIEGGVGSRNITNTVENGNLFTFIGFPEGSNPIGELKNSLEDSFSTEVKHKKSNQFELQIDLDIEKVYKENPYPWAVGDSWVRGIETNIPGMAYYLNTKTKKSRSGGGIQVENLIRNTPYRPIGFLSPLIKQFVEDVIK